MQDDGGGYGLGSRTGRGRRTSGGKGLGRGGNRGVMGGEDALGIGGTCYCPGCNYEASHQRGLPCYQMKCPECGISMARKPQN
jgi:hypothetical protein